MAIYIKRFEICLIHFRSLRRRRNLKVIVFLPCIILTFLFPLFYVSLTCRFLYTKVKPIFEPFVILTAEMIDIAPGSLRDRKQQGYISSNVLHEDFEPCPLDNLRLTPKQSMPKWASCGTNMNTLRSVNDTCSST